MVQGILKAASRYSPLGEDSRGELYGMSYGGSHLLAEEVWFKPALLEYESWENIFNARLEDLQAGRYVLESYDELARSTMQDYFARNVLNEYLFFADPGINAPAEVFQIVTSEGKMSSLSPQQIMELYTSGEFPIPGAEIHHLHTVSEIMEGGLVPDRLVNPVNALIFETREAHLAFGHGGNWQNSTPAEIMEAKLTLEEKVALTESFNYEALVPGTLEMAIYVAGLAGVTVFTISSLCNLWRLRNDPRPWQQKLAFSVEQAGLQALMAMPLASAGFITSSMISGFIASLPGFGASSLFLSVLPVGAGVFTAMLLFSGVKAISAVVKGKNWDGAFDDFKNVLWRELKIIAGISLGALVVDGIVDLFFEEAVGSILPFVGPIYILIRLLISFWDYGKRKENERAMQRYFELRDNAFKNSLYAAALNEIKDLQRQKNSSWITC